MQHQVGMESILVKRQDTKAASTSIDISLEGTREHLSHLKEELEQRKILRQANRLNLLPVIPLGNVPRAQWCTDGFVAQCRNAYDQTTE